MKEPVATLKQLLEQDPDSRKLYDALSPDQQLSLQELRQDIATFEVLAAAVKGFHQQRRG